jgi:hypothetical protein
MVLLKNVKVATCFYAKIHPERSGFIAFLKPQLELLLQ